MAGPSTTQFAAGIRRLVEAKMVKVAPGVFSKSKWNALAGSVCDLFESIDEVGETDVAATFIAGSVVAVFP